MTCGFCRGPVLRETLLSGNTFGATLWSDGMLDAPMHPGGQLLVKCPHCDELLLPQDLHDTEITSWGGMIPRDDVEALRPKSVEPEDLLSVVNRRISPAEKRGLRTRYWWAMNDPRRGNSDHPTELSEVEIDNLERLLELTRGESDEERLTRAEIKRALGDFEGAQEEAERVESREFRGIATRIGALASAGERRVARLS